VKTTAFVEGLPVERTTATLGQKKDKDRA